MPYRASPESQPDQQRRLSKKFSKETSGQDWSFGQRGAPPALLAPVAYSGAPARTPVSLGDSRLPCRLPLPVPLLHKQLTRRCDAEWSVTQSRTVRLPCSSEVALSHPGHPVTSHPDYPASDILSAGSFFPSAPEGYCRPCMSRYQSSRPQRGDGRIGSITTILS